MTAALAVFAVVFTLAVAILGTLAVAGARDAIPSKADAREYIVERFPAAAPTVLLKDRRARQFHTASLWVQQARRCRRTSRQVECRFTLRMLPNDSVPHQPAIHCRGEVWVKLKDGRLAGRPGDYACVA